MKRPIAGLLVVALLSYAPWATGEDHLVSPEIVRLRLAEAGEMRNRSMAALRSFLSQPAARDAATAVDMNLDSVAAQLPVLGNQELEDLADRAAQLAENPVTGTDAAKVVAIVLAVVGLVLILLVVACYAGGCGE